MDNIARSVVNSYNNNISSGNFTPDRSAPKVNSGADLPPQGCFAGADIVAGIYVPVLGQFLVFGELSTITYSIHREFYPVRGLGTINAKGYTRGPRTIAGSLVFTVFDRHVLHNVRQQIKAAYLQSLQDNGYNWASNSKLANMKLVTDEMPPFDVIISMANERDAGGAVLRIYGLRITNEGQTMSIEDMITENTMQYLATDIDLMEPKAANDLIMGSYQPQAGAVQKDNVFSIFPTSASFLLNGTGETPSYVSIDLEKKGIGDPIWNAEVTDGKDWITITYQGKHKYGSHDGMVEYTIANNDSGGSRTGMMRIAGIDFLVQQWLTQPYDNTLDWLSVSPNSIRLAYENVGVQKLTVNGTHTWKPDGQHDATEQATWHPETLVDWITFTSSDPVTGDGTVEFTVEDNSNDNNDRTAQILIKGTSADGKVTGQCSCFVTQVGNTEPTPMPDDPVPEEPQTSAQKYPDSVPQPTPTSENFIKLPITSTDWLTNKGGKYSFQVVTVDDVEWTAATKYDWISINQSKGKGNGEVIYTLLPNPDPKNKRMGAIVVTADRNGKGEVFLVVQDFVENRGI